MGCKWPTHSYMLSDNSSTICVASGDDVVFSDRRCHPHPVPNTSRSWYVRLPTCVAFAHRTSPSTFAATLCRICVPQRLALLRAGRASQVQRHARRVRRARSISPRQGASPVNPCAHARFHDMKCPIRSPTTSRIRPTAFSITHGFPVVTIPLTHWQPSRGVGGSA